MPNDYFKGDYIFGDGGKGNVGSGNAGGGGYDQPTEPYPDFLTDLNELGTLAKSLVVPGSTGSNAQSPTTGYTASNAAGKNALALNTPQNQQPGLIDQIAAKLKIKKSDAEWMVAAGIGIVVLAIYSSKRR